MVFGIIKSKKKKNTTAPDADNKKDILELFNSKKNLDNVRLIDCLTVLGLTELYKRHETRTI